MTYLTRKSSRVRLLEAENARKNRLEIVKALADGQITKRDLFRWGIFTGAGLLVAKNGLSPFARSAYAAVPTGTPPSPIPPGLKFTERFRPLVTQTRLPLRAVSTGAVDPVTGRKETDYQFMDPTGTNVLSALPAKRTSYHSHWNANPATFRNPITGIGPIEGRPGLRPNDGDYFAHQRWDEFPPKFGFLTSLGQVAHGSSYLPSNSSVPTQGPNAVWSFGARLGVEF